MPLGPGGSMSDILVLGATGTTGRRLAPLLLDAGHAVRSATRRPGDVAPLPGLQPVAFDWDDASGWRAALAGADAVYLVAPALRLDPGDAMATFVREAAVAGVDRIVLLSTRAVEQLPAAASLHRIELAVQGAGPAWTILRPTWFAQNITEGLFAAGARERGELVAPAGEGAVPFIDVADIAAVAAVALTEDGHERTEYALSGPRLMTFAEAAGLLAEGLGRPVRHVDLPSESWRRLIKAEMGIPDDYATFLAARFDAIRAGADAHLSDGVRVVLGRPPHEPFAHISTHELTTTEV